MELDDYQRAAAFSTGAVLGIRAGSGSGKTRVGLARALWLAERRFERVRVATFTRSAAAELARRLELERPDLRERIRTGTLHSFAAEIVLPNAAKLPGGDRGLSIVDGGETEILEREAKAKRIPVERLLRTSGLVRYSELLEWASILLEDRSNPVSIEATGAAWIIDEAQDLTAAEWRFVEALRPVVLTSIGDLAQAIFGWRGGLGRLLPPRIEDEAVRSGAVVNLPTSYRSLAKIVEVAGRLEIPGRLDLLSNRGWGGRVEAFRTGTDGEVVERIASGGFGPLGELGVLSRSRARLESLAEKLEARGVCVWSPVLEGKVWDRPEVRRVLDLLSVAQRQHDDLRCARVLLAAGVSQEELRSLEIERCGLRPQSLWNAAVEAFSAKGGEPIATLEVVADLADGIYRRISAREIVADLALSGRAPADLAERIPAGASVDDLFVWISSPASRDEAIRERPADSVELSTMHGAKGREWPRVLVLGCEEGHFPASKAKTPAELLEERRLCYVALTRARDAATFHCSAWRPGWMPGQVIPSEPSRFFGELGLL